MKTMFSAQSLPNCYKQDSWSNELIVWQLPVGKNMGVEA
jgi:hypothetical protein